MSRKTVPREIEVDIESLDDSGLGEGRFGERAVHVRNALPGETVTARVLKRRGGSWYAEVPADDAVIANRSVGPRVRYLRAESSCSAFPRCGGCALHHMDYAEQLGFKEERLLSALAGQDVVPQKIRPPVSVVRTGYRRKARLGVRVVGEEVLVGFRESFSNRVARLTDCLTLTPELASAIVPLRHAIGQMEAPHRIPQIEFAQGDVGVVAMVRHLEPLSPAEVAVWQQFAASTGLRVYLQPGGYETLTGLDGRREVDYLSFQNADFGLSFEFLPTDFTQVNQPLNLALVRTAIGLFDPLAGRTVADLFCGIGNFSLPLARRGACVIGVESSADAVVRANHNAKRNGLAARCEFRQADLYDGAPPDIKDCDALLLDPPRSGAGPYLDSFVAGRATEVVYVSCNPATFATDARVLVNRGFQLASVGIFDMFPYTSHVETLGYFNRLHN